MAPFLEIEIAIRPMRSACSYLHAFHVYLRAEKTLLHIDFLLAFLSSLSDNFGSEIIPVANIITIHSNCRSDKNGNWNFGRYLEVSV